MADNITLLAGEPNDDNRAYLPEAIKGSRMVVNENGNNSQVYPKNLQEFCESITDDGLTDTWFEYVPESYDPAKKTPLVFSMHGGLMTGWGQCIYTSWTHVADREGFICVFPNAHDKRMWMIECDPNTIDELSQPMPEGIPSLNKPTGTVEEYHDVRLVLALLNRMKKRYNIDEGRVFMQGMSMGDCMTSQVARSQSRISVWSPSGRASSRTSERPICVSAQRMNVDRADTSPSFSQDHNGLSAQRGDRPADVP